MENVVTPTGQAIIRKAVAQPYLQDLMTRQAAQYRGVDKCAIL
jgi:hypothetical protein